jgi:6-phosphogluconolactonase (cycloisomerase 2 family)
MVPRIRRLIVAAFVLNLCLAATPVRAALLESVDVARQGMNGVTGLAGVLAVVVSPDGRHVYAAGASDDAVDVFERNGETGALTLVQVAKDGVGTIDGLAFPASLALSPDGAHLYVAAGRSNGVAVFGRDAATGALTFIESQRNGVAGVEGLTGASAVVVSGDGSFVYAAGQQDHAVVVFRRNALTGWLTFVEVVRQGVNGITGIAGPLGLAVSPDGMNLYVASGDLAAVGAFRRDATTGRLRLVDVEDEEGLTFGLSGIHSVAVSPDGAHVYATAQADSAVVTFRRNPRSGALTMTDVVSEGLDEIDGLAGALRATVSPDGANVYVASTHANTISAFTRDKKSGALTYVESQTGAPICTCLAFARAVAVSPDNKSVYVAGASSNAVSVFRVTGK